MDVENLSDYFAYMSEDVETRRLEIIENMKNVVPEKGERGKVTLVSIKQQINEMISYGLEEEGLFIHFLHGMYENLSDTSYRTGYTKGPKEIKEYILDLLQQMYEFNLDNPSIKKYIEDNIKEIKKK